ncbi:MAG: hypothetical protein ACXAD7_16690 [Candidatus Kariarchaeaceae archaeon]|jgi:hypothetical protein
MERSSLLPCPCFGNIQYPGSPPNNGIILSSGLIRKLGARKIHHIVSSLCLSKIVFEDAEDVQLAVVGFIEKEQIWLVKSTIDSIEIFTLMLSTEF